MGETATSTDKSSKTPRHLKTPPRQVRFEDSNGIQVTTAAEYAARVDANANASSNTNANANTNAGNNDKADTPATADSQPINFPALGFPPDAQQQQQKLLPGPQLGPGQWFTSGNPGQSVSQTVHQPPAYAHLAAPFTPGFPHPAAPVNISLPHLQPHPQPAYIYHPLQQHQPTNVVMAADYQNAAPMPQCVNFQPPVPDNSLGPMNHVYIPRFDGGIAPQQAHGPPGLHVRLPPVQFIPTNPPSTLANVIIPPKAFYLNGYVYYYYAS